MSKARELLGNRLNEIEAALKLGNYLRSSGVRSELSAKLTRANAMCRISGDDADRDFLMAAGICVQNSLPWK